MDVGQVTQSAPMSMAIQNLKLIAETQMAVAQTLAEGQAQTTALSQASGIGQNLNIHA